jgi:uncharacterized protein YlaI
MSVTCPECESEQLSWALAVRQTNRVPSGRLTLHDVEPIIVLGCDECSATVSIVADDDRLNELIDPSEEEEVPVEEEH